MAVMEDEEGPERNIVMKVCGVVEVDEIDGIEGM